MARKLRETLSKSSALDWADATGVLSKARRMIKEQQAAVDPQRWQCCMTPELLTLARSGYEHKALEMLMNGLLGEYSNGLCSNIGECVSGGCPTRNQGNSGDQESAGPAANQDRMPQTAGDYPGASR